MLYTTLNKIKTHQPCADGWKTLLDALGRGFDRDEPIPLTRIIKTNGVNDAIWALRACERQERIARLFACDCAERLLPAYESEYPNDDRPRRAIETARLFALGMATVEELETARVAALGAEGAAEDGAAWAAARAAAWAAAWAPGDAAWGAAKAAVWAAARREWQKQRLIELLDEGVMQ